MTDVASLELCKELYELSGWGETDFYHNTSSGGTVVVAPAFQSLSVTGKPLHERHPAYTLGYLLRKLQAIKPENIEWGVVTVELSHSKDGWFVKQSMAEHINAIADTPEDAAAKLAIELFKQGVLKS